MLKRFIVLSVAALVSFAGGCDWPWSEKKIESTPEMRARYVSAVDDLIKLRQAGKISGEAAQAALHAGQAAQFDQHLMDLRQNLEQQIELMRTIESNVSTHDLRKKVVAERERTEYDLSQLSEYEKIWKNQVELGKWRAIDWR